MIYSFQHSHSKTVFQVCTSIIECACCQFVHPMWIRQFYEVECWLSSVDSHRSHWVLSLTGCAERWVIAAGKTVRSTTYSRIIVLNGLKKEACFHGQQIGDDNTHDVPLLSQPSNNCKAIDVCVCTSSTSSYLVAKSNRAARRYLQINKHRHVPYFSQGHLEHTFLCFSKERNW